MSFVNGQDEKVLFVNFAGKCMQRIHECVVLYDFAEAQDEETAANNIIHMRKPNACREMDKIVNFAC
jgi:hypothetical protein